MTYLFGIGGESHSLRVRRRRLISIEEGGVTVTGQKLLRRRNYPIIRVIIVSMRIIILITRFYFHFQIIFKLFRHAIHTISSNDTLHLEPVSFDLKTKRLLSFGHPFSTTS